MTPPRIAAFLLLIVLQVAGWGADEVANGTGFYVGNKTILTCAHCVPNNGKIIVVRSDSKLLVAKVAFVERQLDLAVLHTDEPSENWLPVGNSDTLKLLDDLSVFGFPLAATLGSDLSASQGKLNSRRKVEGRELLQLDATMNPGNSGGPVIDQKGEVVGIAVARLNHLKSLRETGAIPERINFAIPSNAVRSRLEEKKVVIGGERTTINDIETRDLAIRSTVLLLIVEDSTSSISEASPELPEAKPSGGAASPVAPGNLPRVVIPESNRHAAPTVPRIAGGSFVYPWRLNVIAEVFWLGETSSEVKSAPKGASTWDPNWVRNFGGPDEPEKSKRIADHKSFEFRPKAFVPKSNPFYVALPYNDVMRAGYKSEAPKVIPWFARSDTKNGASVLKGRWVQIFNGKYSCYAQWEECGPSATNDFDYVFLNKLPKGASGDVAGIGVSPSVRDYLDMQPRQRCHWRFVESSQVPYGAWKKYGQAASTAIAPDMEAQRRYLEYLKKMRDEQSMRRSERK